MPVCLNDISHVAILNPLFEVRGVHKLTHGPSTAVISRKIGTQWRITPHAITSSLGNR